MTLGKMLDNEDAILAQHNTIGFPKLEELQSSPNTQWVEPYVNNQGKQDGGYWQSVLEPMYQESYMPRQPKINYQHGINGPVLLENTKEGILDNSSYYQDGQIESSTENQNDEKNILLEGYVEKNQPVYERIKENIENNIGKLKAKIDNTAKKYEGLDAGQAAQKAASKILPYNYVENEYYRNSLKMKDGEPLTDKFLEENDIYALKDIKDEAKFKEYYKDLAKTYNLDPNDKKTYEKLLDKKIVIPKETSRLYQYAKDSDAMEKWVVENYDRIKNGEKPIDNSIEFPAEKLSDDKKRGLFGTIHNANTNNIKINDDNSLSIDLDDNYDYAKWKEHKWNWQDSIKDNLIKKAIINLNNNAYEQQENKQLENYPIKLHLNYTKEELEELLRKYKRINY